MKKMFAFSFEKNHSRFLVFLFPLLLLQSCTVYYSAPPHHPPLLEKKGSVDASANMSVKEAGATVAAMPVENLAVQLSIQTGRFTYDGPTTSYGYREAALGYQKKINKAKVAAYLFYGQAGQGVFVRNYIWQAEQRSRMQQYGCDLFFYPGSGDALVIPGLRINYVNIDKVTRSGDLSKVSFPSNVPGYTGGWVYVPSVTCMIGNKKLKLNIQYSYTICPKLFVPEIRPYSLNFGFNYTFNYLGH